ncbi:hypothetical protein LXN10_12155 [Arcobacter sp. KX21116]|jgi:hypothetical protein|uniref:hypothetical protein n=1 Tax=Arcobacter iocasae TaxID=2906515 RepID=UPI0035D4B00D|tara:strand:- start:3950 stop:4240 length:291 start_codon:yes stop_codon:yes gene_type:complete
MKIVLILATFFLTSLFANYAYSPSNSQKIDMHGGNSDSLIGNNNSLSNMNSNSLSNLATKKDKETKKETGKLKISKETPKEKDEEKNLGELEDLGL